MNNKFRCNCPITSALDILGDKWTLVIIKQMLLQDKKTFKDFTNSEEAIATNILTVRMKNLVELNLVSKKQASFEQKVSLLSFDRERTFYSTNNYRISTLGW